MDNKYISLLNPKENLFNQKIFISDCDYKTLIGNYLYCRDLEIYEFLTDDIETIKYRQELFRDVLNEPKFLEVFKEILPMLENINELYRLRDNSHETEGQIYSIKLIELYISFISILYFKLTQFESGITSKSLFNFYSIIKDIYNNCEFKNLVKNTEILSHDILTVKSITIGLNIDHTFSPYEFGILSFNSEPMISVDFIDKLLHKNKKEQLTALCPLKITSKQLTKEEKRFSDLAINSVINRFFKNSIREWEPAIKSFFRTKTKSFLPLIKELKFIIFGVNILRELNDKYLPLAMPKIKDKKEKIFNITGIYHPVIALQKDKVVYNDVEFDTNGRIYLITGPNSGGKTIFISAIGICQIFAQLGFLVPAKSAEISPVDTIFVSFVSKSNSKNKGRLEEECTRIKEIFDCLTEYSFVLMDETFSTTSSYEGAHIAFDVIAGMSAFGCKVIYSTHMHELVSMIKEINDYPDSVSKIDVLTAEINAAGNRTYKITRGISDGKSYARNISNMYGLSYEKIISRLKD